MNAGQKDPSWLQAAREQWTYTGAKRPDFAVEPGPGQESVWDYPRPPAVAADGRLVEVIGASGQVIASTRQAIRVMETSLPPSFYLPANAIVEGALVPGQGRSHCEWKGEAQYLAEPGGQDIGWRYPKPYEQFVDYANWVSFYPNKVQCQVNGEVARPQQSSFYGGWITSELVGPFKGDPGVPGM